jgi:hypothetical protein
MDESASYCGLIVASFIEDNEDNARYGSTMLATRTPVRVNISMMKDVGVMHLGEAL